MSSTLHNSHSEWSPEGRLRLFLFALCGLATYLVVTGLSSGRGSSQPVAATAICSGPGALRVAQRVADQLKSEKAIRASLAKTQGDEVPAELLASFTEHLVINTDSAGLDQRRINVEYIGPLSGGAAAVNNLVKQGVASNQRAVDPTVELEVELARGRVNSTQAELEALKDDLDRYLAKNFEAMQPQPAPPVQPPAPIAAPIESAPLAENPEWGALRDQLQQQQAYRTDLLGRMTPTHPVVLELDARITELTTQLRATPQLLEPEVAESEPTTPVASPSVAKSAEMARRELVAEYQRLQQRYEAVKQQLLEHQQALEQAEVRLADSNCTLWVSTWADAARGSRLGIGLAFVLALACGGGIALKGVAENPNLQNIADVGSQLSIPVVAVVTSQEKSLRPKAQWTLLGKAAGVASALVIGGYLLRMATGLI